MDNISLKKCRNIRNGRNLEELLPWFFNYMADHYYTHAIVRLAMHYETLYEAYIEERNSWSKDSKDIFNSINRILRNSMLHNQSGSSRKEAVKDIDKLRNEVIKRMDILTAYTDVYQIYEYVLNRVEYRFKDDTITIDDEEFAREVLGYIFNTRDNFMINEKIKEIVGQLPIRMTKQRYFDYLKESLQPYLGQDASQLETYLYMLRTSAMLYEAEGMDTRYPNLWEQKSRFSEIKYGDISLEEFEKASDELGDIIDFLETETSVYYGLQEVINEIYAVLLCIPFEGLSSFHMEDRKNAALQLIAKINQEYLDISDFSPAADRYGLLEKMEGVQEMLIPDLSELEDTLYKIDQNYRSNAESLMLKGIMNIMLRSRDLLSDSLFIDFESEKLDKLVDRKLLDTVTDKLLIDLSKLFQKHDREIVRAVMANTLNKMPVFFKNHKEVMDYVLYSLDRCTDQIEKQACVEIIRDIMTV